MSENTHNAPNSGNKKPNRSAIALLVALLCILGLLVWKNAVTKPIEPVGEPPSVSDISTAEPKQTPETDDNGLAKFEPYAVDSTKPSNFIKFSDVSVNGKIDDTYKARDEIDFGIGDDYTDVKGIVTFRGNNFRDGGSYGTAKIKDKQFSDDYWTVHTGSMQAPNGNVWTGSGWVGQPLVMTWPKKVREHMNMYDWAKEADTLTEVIYATMDGNVYFIDLKSGEKTRDDLYLGYSFKGSGALDPRGYPILYLGAGYDSSAGISRAFIINLLDCSIMYEFGEADSFSLRGTLSYFDGSPLVDGKTDQLIYPGENGILYIIKLNTNYDKNMGTLSMDPDNVVRWRYNGVRTTQNSYWLGMEDSPVIWRGHIIMSDNGGNLMCLDLNTLELDWVQDVLDDTNCSPVLEIEDGHPYIYTSTSFHGGWRAPMDSTADVPIWKFDAVTGEIVWQTDYKCYTQDGVSGGTQGTLALGKNNLSDLIFVPVARTPSPSAGILVALDKGTGEVVWKIQTQMYAWSSPVTVYTDEGEGYIVFCTTGGYMYLIDGLTGEVLDYIDLGGNVEASPIVYNNNIVIGTRAQKIWGIPLT